MKIYELEVVASFTFSDNKITAFLRDKFENTQIISNIPNEHKTLANTDFWYRCDNYGAHFINLMSRNYRCMII